MICITVALKNLKVVVVVIVVAVVVVVVVVVTNLQVSVVLHQGELLNFFICAAVFGVKGANPAVQSVGGHTSSVKLTAHICL